MIAIGLDQGTKKCGFSIFKDGVLLSSGTFCASEKLPIEERTMIIYDQIKNCVTTNLVKHMVFEEVTMQGMNNVKLHRDLSRLQGTLLVICHELKIPYTILYPSTWRNQLGFKGKKREEMKAQAIKYVNEKHGMNLMDKQDDEAEAIAIFDAYQIMLDKNYTP